MSIQLTIGLLIAFVVVAYYGLTYDKAQSKRTAIKPAPIVPPAEVSCFVKGLIRSMRETPSQWTYSSDRWYCNWYCNVWTWTHKSNIQIERREVREWGADGVIRQYTTIDRHPLKSHDSDALRIAITTYLDNPRIASIKAQNEAIEAARQAKLAAERAPWEALGCPTTNQSSGEPDYSDSHP